MDSGNVSQLVVPQTRTVDKRTHVKAPERDAEFLSLRLLNKRGRVRLSSAGLNYSRLPGKVSLLAVGNKKRCFAAAVCKHDGSNHVLVSTLGDLRTAFESGHPDPDPFINFTPREPLLSVPGIPAILKFALNDDRLLVGFLEGPILVYSTDDLFVPTRDNQPNPIYTFPGDSSTIPRDISPNPGESPELVAILRGVHGREPGHQIDVVDVKSLKHIGGWRKGNDPNAAPVSISWSPKGKQIAIGLQSGDMILYSPRSTATPKSHILKPPSTPAGASSLLATTWLSNPTFHTVYSTPEASSSLFDSAASEKPSSVHFISSHDSKSRSAIDVELLDPCPPFGAERPPGPLSVVLRNWSPTKFIIFCGDGPSADIGVIGTLPGPSGPIEDMWVNFSLEETSTPSLPLGEDSMDTALLGLEIDLTSSKSIRMSEQPDDGTPDLPPSPILYAYVSDGTVVAWHILNSKGEAYPGMIAGSGDVIPTALCVPQRMESEEVCEMSSRVSSPVPRAHSPLSSPTQVSGSSTLPAPSFGQLDSTSPAIVTPSTPAFGGFGGVNMTSKFASTGFGFGASPAQSAAPAFGSTGFSRPTMPNPDAHKASPSPASGTTSFGQIARPTFGASGFGAKATTTPAFGQSGFSGPASSGAVKSASNFGSSSGGFASFAKQGTSTFGAPVNHDPSTSESQAGLAPLFGQGKFGRLSSPTLQSGFEASLNPSASSSARQTLAFGQNTFGSSYSVPMSTSGADGMAQANPNPVSVFGTGGVGQATMATQTAFGQQQALKPMSPFGGFGQKAATPTSESTGFGSTPIATTPQSGGFGMFGGEALNRSSSLTPAKFDSPPGSPTSSAGSPPGSPELHSRSLPMKSASSYLKPAEGFGAFIRPAEGLGTSAGPAKSASFIKPAKGFRPAAQDKFPSAQQKSAASSLNSTGSGSSAKPAANSTVPTFGSTSALGSSKPVFGTSTFGKTPQPAVSEPSKPITGGFSAFSSAGGGFASFANTVKPTSFADILSSGEPEKPKSYATPLAFGGTSVLKSPTLGIPDDYKVPLIPSAGKPGDVLQIHAGKAEKDPGNTPSTSKSPRPKTPPLLGAPSSVSNVTSVPLGSLSAPPARPVTPKIPPAGKLGDVLSIHAGNAEKDSGNTPSTSKPSRPKTPPLLGAASAVSNVSSVPLGSSSAPPTRPVTPKTGKLGDVLQIHAGNAEKDSGISLSTSKSSLPKTPPLLGAASSVSNVTSATLGSSSAPAHPPAHPVTPKIPPAEKLADVLQIHAGKAEKDSGNKLLTSQSPRPKTPPLLGAASSVSNVTSVPLGSSSAPGHPPAHPVTPKFPPAEKPVDVLQIHAGNAEKDSGNKPSTSKSPRPKTPPLLGAPPYVSNVTSVPLGSSSAPGPPAHPVTPKFSPAEKLVMNVLQIHAGEAEKDSGNTPSTFKSPRPKTPPLLGAADSVSNVTSIPLGSSSATGHPPAHPVTPKVPPAGQPGDVFQIHAGKAGKDSGHTLSTSKSPRPKTPPLLGAASSVSKVTSVPLGSSSAPGYPPAHSVTPKVPRPPAQTSLTTPAFSATSEEEEEIPKHPMQVEFLRVYQEMTMELVHLYKRAQEMTLIRPIISEPRGLDKLVLNGQEFQPGKYSHGDLAAFATILGTLRNRVVPLLEQGNANKRLLQDLQNLALISETKQEELSRWVQARLDPDFAKALKSRTLGPEHSENQIRLRKVIQAYHDRIQQCEDEMESLKTRLEKHKTGKVGLRPPSLDTIDRTCRNIQLALEERTKALEHLRKRIETLSPRDSHRLQSPHGHLSSPISSRGAVSPPFANVAAAALNSERSLLRLKSALLSIRREPLLTTGITKLEIPNPVVQGAQVSSEVQRPEWKLPPVPPLGMSSVARRAGRTTKRHGAVQLKANTPGANNKYVTFDWGPLPGAAPMERLSMDVRSHKGKSDIGFVDLEVGDDTEWDKEAEEDYKRHH